MITFVREMNYADSDSLQEADQFDADYFESIEIRKLEKLERNGYFGRRIFRLVGKVVKYFNA
jgi:hypothetical protein